MASFIAGISLTCFAASYGVAWALELSRLVWAGKGRRILALAFVAAGLLAHTLYLGYRVVELSASPLSSSFDWCLLAAWLLVVAFLYLAWCYPRAPLALWMLPLALALVVAAAFADRRPFDSPGASRVWGAVHGISLLIGTLAVMVGFVAGAMYLVQARRLKRKRPPSGGFGLPGLERLEKINGRVLILSAFAVGIGFLAGIILNVVGRDGASELPWSDPVIWTSAFLLAWLLAAAIFNAVYRPARRGRKVAYLTVVSFLFLAVALAALLLVSNEHVGQKQPTQALLPGPPTRGCHGWLAQQCSQTFCADTLLDKPAVAHGEATDLLGWHRQLVVGVAKQQEGLQQPNELICVSHTMPLVPSAPGQQVVRATQPAPPDNHDLPLAAAHGMGGRP